jgi:hypothetical protein
VALAFSTLTVAPLASVPVLRAPSAALTDYNLRSLLEDSATLHRAPPKTFHKARKHKAA